MEHLSVPFLRRRQLVGRRHRHLHRPPQEPDPPQGEPVRLRPGRIAVRLGPVHQGSRRALRRGRQPRHLGDQGEGSHHGFDPGLPGEREIAAPMSLPAYLRDVQTVIEGYARAYGLDFFPTSFEILSYKQMNEVAAYGGLPTRHPHWRFGMDYEGLSKGYEYGLQKIYEMVINNNPSYAYLLEGNSIVDQKTVMAHVFGHVDFFKNNYFFSQTNRRMIDGMANHATRVRKHIERHGIDKIEQFIDTCLSLETLIDPMSPFIVRGAKPPKEEDGKDKEQGEVPKLRSKDYMDRYINPPSFVEQQKKRVQQEKEKVKKFPEEKQRDVLLFL